MNINWLLINFQYIVAIYILYKSLCKSNSISSHAIWDIIIFTWFVDILAQHKSLNLCNTVQCPDNVVNVLQNIDKRHPIARPSRCNGTWLYLDGIKDYEPIQNFVKIEKMHTSVWYEIRGALNADLIYHQHTKIFNGNSVQFHVSFKKLVLIWSFSMSLP